MIYIGIDPDKGWAEWDGDKKIFRKIITTDFFSIIEQITFIAWTQDKSKYSFYVEAPYLIKPTFFRKSLAEDNIKKLDAIAQRVGANKEKAKLIVGYINHLGFKCWEIKPNKYSYSKLSSKRFKQITGYMERTSEHGRDAAMLVFGR